MCGIFLLLNVDAINKLIIEAFQCGKGRGPEKSTISAYKRCILGFHRLAINGLDMENDNQPLNIKDCTLICNGEIYNSERLAGHFTTMETDNDCEIIIHLYKEYGIEHTLQLLDGVFAFALLDHKKGEMYIARDGFGVRPLYMSNRGAYWGFASEMKAIIHDELPHNETSVKPVISIFNPGTHMKFSIIENNWRIDSATKFTSKNICTDYTLDYGAALQRIRSTLTEAVSKRVFLSDRPIACLLSGGLDSSLIASLVHSCYKPLETFSIGLKGSTDLKFAKIVAEYLGTKHHEIIVTDEEFLDAIPETIRVIESYDTTTVRASVGNYLVSKYIKEHSNAKVIFNGDGADEVCGGYMYFNYADDPLSFDQECHRLLDDIHIYDVLRSDRCISSCGLEPRTPFLDKAFVQTYLSIPADIRDHGHKNKQGKYLIRDAFKNMLPTEVLYRTKEAFSDGVSPLDRSWYKIIQQYIKRDKTIQEMISQMGHYPHNPPKTDEQKYYRLVFEHHYGGHSNIIPYFWMPKWVDAPDCSARELSVYKHKSCEICKGCGLTKHKKKQCCEKGCYKCENTKRLGMYKECAFCKGSGGG